MPYPHAAAKPVVLCVDDDSSVLAVTALALQLDGCTVLTAEGGAAALELFRSHHFDAVVLDYEMPGMDGGALAEAIQALDPRVPKLLFTGRADLPASVLGKVEGVCWKPSGIGALRSRVRLLLGNPCRQAHSMAG